ncbi:MAG: class I SAM-dependent methyltransferase [Candidatus Woesebacteria bacterium]|nr:MAG: class I SAM-dependent methyltransferase [Candidatus Woesebacteria bacterium]
MSKKTHFKKQKEYFEKDLSFYENYDKSLNAWRLSYIKRIKKALHYKYKKKTIVDVGTGSGYVAIEMAKLDSSVLATDIVESTLKNIIFYAKKKKLKVKTLICPAEKIPIKAKTADLVVANSVLEHIPNESAAIIEWKRITKNNGKIFVTIPLSFKYIWPFFWLVNYLYDRMLGHLRRYDLNSLQKKFGLEIEQVYYTGHLIKFLWFLISRPFLGGIRSSSKIDYFFEDLDQKFENIPFGASNLVVIFKKEK